MFAVFDLDSTLSNTEHRKHYLQDQQPKDWDAFFNAQCNDEVIRPMLNLMRALYRSYVVLEIWSARPNKYRQETWLWLNNVAHIYSGENSRPRDVGQHHNDIIINRLLMRPTEDSPG